MLIALHSRLTHWCCWSFTIYNVALIPPFYLRYRSCFPGAFIRKLTCVDWTLLFRLNQIRPLFGILTIALLLANFWLDFLNITLLILSKSIEYCFEFFKSYYYIFSFDADAISVRLGRKTERAVVAQNQSPYNHLSQWHCICIEEPFTFSNTAHSVYDERIFDSIKRSFVEGYHELETNRELDAFLGAKPNLNLTSSVPLVSPSCPSTPGVASTMKKTFEKCWLTLLKIKL